MHDFRRTVKEVISVVKVCESTLRKRWVAVAQGLGTIRLGQAPQCGCLFHWAGSGSRQVCLLHGARSGFRGGAASSIGLGQVLGRAASIV